LPSGYFNQNLLVARADQLVLRQYVAEVLPKLDAKLAELEVDLDMSSLHWFLSAFAGVLTGGEALYRTWDVIFCLNSSSEMPNHFTQRKNLGIDIPNFNLSAPVTPTLPTTPELPEHEHDGTSSPFLFQLSLALLKLNESAILTLDSPAACYSYFNSSMTNHAITVDQLIQAAEALRTSVKRSDVLERRKAAVKLLDPSRNDS